MSEAVRTIIYLVRHCDVENPNRVLYGHLPNFGLSEKGKRQAQALGEFFVDKPVAQLYASPLQRAQETAQAIIARRPDLHINTTDELIEARFGKYLQGVRPRDVPWRRPLWFVHKAFPGLLPFDESVRAMATRARAPILRLLRDHPGRGGICISHGDPIQAFWNVARGKGRFVRLDCVKGGMLELTFNGSHLDDITYRSPESIGAPSTHSVLEDVAVT